MFYSHTNMLLFNPVVCARIRNHSEALARKHFSSTSLEGVTAEKPRTKTTSTIRLYIYYYSYVYCYVEREGFEPSFGTTPYKIPIESTFPMPWYGRSFCNQLCPLLSANAPAITDLIMVFIITLIFLSLNINMNIMGKAMLQTPAIDIEAHKFIEISNDRAILKYK